MSQINESAIATPGVYINEINSFPPAVAQVSTAIPVFVGYTAQAFDANGNNVTNKAVQISSFAEYAAYFGGLPSNLNTVVTLDNNDNVTAVNVSPAYQMYNSLYMFFQNGGGTCYIFSVGTYKTSNPLISLTDFIPSGSSPSCFDTIRKIDDITLLVFPDSVLFTGTTASATNVNDYYTLMTSALTLCGNLQDRFTIIDVVNGNNDRTFDSNDVITNFRTGIGSMNLNYGAVYYPFLETTLQLPSDYENIQIVTPSVTTPTNIYSLTSLISGNNIFTQINNAVADSVGIVAPAFPSLQPFPVISDISSFDACLTTLKTYIDNFTGLTGFADSATQNNYLNNYIESALPTGGATPLEKYIGLLNAIISDYPISALHAITTTVITLPTALLTYSGSAIQGVQVTAGGTGYTTAPTVGIASAGSGTGFAATAIISPAGVVTGINVTSQGHNYPGAATVSFTGGGGTGATASIVFADPLIDAPYGTPTPASIQNTLIAISPVLEQLYNNVVNLIQSFINDLNNRINALELQLISSSSVFSNIYSSIVSAGVVVPPSGLLAGVYAATDGTRGVWKAPANVSLSGVIKPTVLIDDQMQENLNIDTVAGKSVNAIRTFSGQGTLVWGARTLAGNDNNWRYISVRRFYIMVESSVKAAAFQFVFEPNVGTTWIRIRSMIESYLTGIWRQGGLAGSKPEQAFYVSVGLGQTMTQDDILNGRMIVEIGMAPVRPAEFIILRFSQIQQQA